MTPPLCRRDAMRTAYLQICLDQAVREPERFWGELPLRRPRAGRNEFSPAGVVSTLRVLRPIGARCRSAGVPGVATPAQLVTGVLSRCLGVRSLAG